MNKLIIEDDACVRRIKVGPRYVFQPDLLHYAATFDPLGPPDVGVSHLGPFWIVYEKPSPLISLGRAELWENGEMLLRHEQPNTDPQFNRTATGGHNFFLDVTVDGNGYFYYFGWSYGFNQIPSLQQNHRLGLRRIKRDGSVVSKTYDVRTLLPAMAPDGFGYTTGIVRAYPAIPQEDGLIAFVRIQGGSDSPANEGDLYYAIKLDSDLEVVSGHWLPDDGLAEPVRPGEPSGAGTFSRGSIGSACLPDGYFAFNLSDPPSDLYKVDSDGNVLESAEDQATPEPSSWFQDDGSYWIRTDSGIRRVNSALVTNTPAWVAGISTALGSGFLEFSVTPSSGYVDVPFRLLVKRQISLTQRRYTTYDIDGNVMLDLTYDGNFASRFMLRGSCQKIGVQHCTGNRFMCGVLDSDGPPNGLHRFAADSILASKPLGPQFSSSSSSDVYLPYFTRGQFAHFSYENWPIGECNCP